MAKKTTRKPVKKTKMSVKSKAKAVKSSVFLNSLPKNEVEYLELLIKFTERATVSRGGKIDLGMQAQAERLKMKLAEAKKSA